VKAKRSTGARVWPRLLLLLGALAVACFERPAPRFPHELHLAGLACGAAGKPACLSCNTCHALSVNGAVQQLPAASVCRTCHHDARAPLQAIVSIVPEHPYGAIAFDHDRHLAMKGLAGQCVACHAGVVKTGGPAFPPMKQCFSCHEHQAQWNLGRCAPCHVDSELKKLLPQSFVRHEGDFMQHHGIDAAQQKPLCQACHAQADCDSCHDATQDLSVEHRRPEAVQRNFVHRGDFMTTHPIEAQSQPARCVRCHTPETCDACHAARGVSASLAQGRNPHPPGWIGNNASASSAHGAAARRDILLCASCHDQGPATNCIRCHKVGAYGGNPHPGGWKSTRSVSAQMCRYCHV